MYVKLFSSILTSSVWSEDAPVRVVWIALLALADREGNVRSSTSGLARISNVTLEDCQRAITRFMAPDNESGTQEFEGRRIEEIPAGWHILNYEKYRDLQDEETRKAQWRESSKRHRDKKKSASVSMESAPSQHASAHTDTEAEAETDADPSSTTIAQNSDAVTPQRDASVDVGRLLGRIPESSRPAWEAEINASRHGMHGPALSQEQIDFACRDFIGNGSAENPSLRHFRGFLRSAGQPPKPPSQKPGASKQEQGRAALANWVAGKETNG